MDKTVSKGKGTPAKSSQDKVNQNSKQDRIGAVWVRADGAVCIDNECITLKPDKDGALDFTYDPDKCSCEEANSVILNAIADCARSGKGIRLEIKPRAK